METLEKYLASDYLSEKQEIYTLDRVISDVKSTFSETFVNGTWPYDFRSDLGVVESKSLSQGTQAMVLIAIGRLLGNCKLPKGSFNKTDLNDKNDLGVKWLEGIEKLITDLQRTKNIVSSFGENNPLTFSHLSELYSLLHDDIKSNQGVNLRDCFANATLSLEDTLQKDFKLGKLLIGSEVTRTHYCTNAFVPLRAIRAGSDLKLAGGNREKIRNFFESTLHEQLSFSAIPDSRFDPAELIFSLEGLLLSAPETVDSALFTRVLDVLSEKQGTSAHWRPNKPFLASATGTINLPISVECANSLMRSTEIMDRDRFHDTFTSKSLPLIQRFWHWLRARSVRLEIHGKKCVGWHSEHVNDANIIHIWDTSQVCEFMIYFREMLERHIASKTLLLSRLKTRRPKKTQGWTKLKTDFEPMLESKFGEKVYSLLETEFVSDWLKGSPKNYSMLLYGPPGTGKSTVAENLADVLQFPMLTAL